MAAVRCGDRRFAALIRRLTGDAHYLARTMRALAAEPREDDDGSGLPSTVAEVTAIAWQAEGMRLGALLAALEPDPRVVECALADILRAAADLPTREDDTGIASQVHQRIRPAKPARPRIRKPTLRGDTS